jgi:hypothetical protein
MSPPKSSNFLICKTSEFLDKVCLQNDTINTNFAQMESQKMLDSGPRMKLFLSLTDSMNGVKNKELTTPSLPTDEHSQW